MNVPHSLQALLNNTATEEDIALLKRLLASGEMSIGGNINQSVIIIGSGNTVELPPAALDRLNARPMLGNLDRDLTGEEIASGLRRLDKLLPNRAPVLFPHYKEQVGRLRPTLKTESKSLSETSRRERVEALAAINSICVEALDVSFNGLCLGEEAPKYDARSPFRGLESFRLEDSKFFFGREALTQKLVEKIKAHSFLAVLGASGSGKSSLVMAGVIPALDLDYAIFRPGMNPLGELESARGKSLIVVDQFEELFTLMRDESTRKDFIACLLDESSRTRIILTLRSDFLGEVGAYRKLSAEIQSHLEIIPPMDLDELRRAMEGQAGVVGLRFEADLSQQILDDVAGEPGVMPLLQHALWELWNRRHGRNLRASEYRAFGGVKQAIANTAEKVYADCSKPEQDQLRDIFLRLTRLDESDEGRDTRRRVPLGDLIPSGRDAASITLLLNKLANARLIMKTVDEDKIEVEVAHEALIRHWERLRLWLNEDRGNLRLRESVSEDAKRWENASREESLLNHRGGRLDDALSLGDDSLYRLTIVEQAYLNACVALRNKEQRERERRLRYTVISSIAAAALFLVLGSFGLFKSYEATMSANAASTAQVKAVEQKNIALARQLAAQAQSIFASGNHKRTTAILLAVQSMQIFPSYDASQILQNNTLAYTIAYMTYDSNVTSVAFSPNGKYVVSAGCDEVDSNSQCIMNSARVWVASTGEEITRMTYTNSVITLAFSPNGKYVVSGSGDGTVRVWDAFSGDEIARMSYDNSVTSAVFSPDSNYVATGGCEEVNSHNTCIKSTARVWNIFNGNEISYIAYNGRVETVAFSPDSKYVVSGGCDEVDNDIVCVRGVARVWVASTGAEISRMNYDGDVTSIAFSPDGKYVVSGGCSEVGIYDGCVNGTARVWETSTGNEITRMSHDSYVTSVAFSPNGKYVISGSYDDTARVWVASTGDEVARMTHDSEVVSVAFSPDGKYVISGSYDGTARVWNAFTGDEISRMNYDGDVTSVAFSPDGKHVVSGGCEKFSSYNICIKGTARVWETSIFGEVARMTHDASVTSLAFSLDGKHLTSGSYDGTARVWEVPTGNEIARMTHDNWVVSIAFSPDGKYVVSGGCDEAGSNIICIKKGTARVWESSTGNEVARINHKGVVTSVAFSPNGKFIVSGSFDNTIRVWEALTGHEVTNMTHESGVVAVNFSPDGKYIVSGGYDGTARVWDAFTGKEIVRITDNSQLESVKFSPDNKYVVSGGYDGIVRVWETFTGKEVAHMMHDNVVTSVAFSPDGRYVVSGSYDNTARVWESLTGHEIARMTHSRNVTSVAFSPDSKYVASGSWDNTVRVWEASTGNEIVRMSHNDSVVSVIFSPDGKYIASGSADNTVRIWIWQPDEFITNACSRLLRNLTWIEWNQYIGDSLAYKPVCPNLPLEPVSTPSP